MGKIRILWVVLAVSVLVGILAFSSFGCAAPSANLTITSSTDANHSHQITIQGSDFDSPADKTYVSTATGGVPHTHAVALTRAQFEEIKKGNSVTITSSAVNNHTHTFTIKK